MSSLAMKAGWVRHVMIGATQQHHTELVGLFRPYIPRDAVVLDVGAHAGQFAKLFARMAPRGIVHAFEPSPYARSILKPALAWNRIKNVKIHGTGLSDAVSQAVLSTPIKKGGDMGFGLAHLGADTGERQTVSQTVTLTTLDKFATGMRLERLDFVKADIEGWEVQLLRGGRNTLARFKPALFLELHADFLSRAGTAPEEVWAMLTPLGYKSFRGQALEPVERYEGAADYLFVAR